MIELTPYYKCDCPECVTYHRDPVYDMQMKAADEFYRMTIDTINGEPAKCLTTEAKRHVNHLMKYVKALESRIEELEFEKNGF